MICARRTLRQASLTIHDGRQCILLRVKAACFGLEVPNTLAAELDNRALWTHIALRPVVVEREKVVTKRFRPAATLAGLPLSI